MKILATSDWHLDKSTAGIHRLSDFSPYLEALIRAARNVDVVVHTGDFFDPGGLDAHRLTSIMIQALAQIAQVAPVVAISGNHDVVETSDGYTVLSPLAAIVDHGAFGDRIWIREKPDLLSFGDTSFLCLPYEARASYDPDRVSEVLERSKSHRRIVVLSHSTVPGAVIGSESREMARGRDMVLPSLRELDPLLVINGHYHRAQVVDYDSIQVHIPGSPHRFTFGEANDTHKGFMIADV